MTVKKSKRKLVKANAGGKFVSPKTADKDETYEITVNTDAKDLAKLKEAVNKIMPILGNCMDSGINNPEERKAIDALRELLK